MEQAMSLVVAANRNYHLRHKRILDIFLSTAALLLSAPLFAIIAILIKVTGRGPVMFRQTRIGLDGQPFVIYKFRTMRPDSERHGLQTRPGDERVTLAGKLLRRPHLDELPQFWNVLKGELSLVGPRPWPAQTIARTAVLVPNIRERLCVKPGLTGLAQIGRNHDHTEEGLKEAFELDIHYINNCSLLNDLGILARTALVMVLGKGV